MTISSTKNYGVMVHIWDTRFREQEPGHASLTVFKNKVEETSGNSLQVRHFGFWPSREFGISDIPIYMHAKEKKSLDEEIHWSADEPPFIPSKCYLVSTTRKQYKNMKKEIEHESEKIEFGVTKYTWLSSLGNLIGRISQYIFSMDGVQRPYLQNCSTITAQILNAGDIPVRTGYAPWGITPSSVGDQLEHLMTTNQIQAQSVPVPLIQAQPNTN